MDAMTAGEKMRTFIESYATAVRAGVITPNIEDEKAVRAIFGLPGVTPAVEAEWARTHGVRIPITLKQEDRDLIEKDANKPPPDGE